MKNDSIVINEDFLKKLQVVYTSQVDEIDGLTGKVVAYGPTPGATVDFTKPLTLHLGGANFNEAQDTVAMIEGIRAGLTTRFKSARAELNTLEYGIKFLLADADATEQLATLNSQQFEYFMPTTGSK